jgi:Zn ribbon nucleic-acid-binding protein
VAASTIEHEEMVELVFEVTQDADGGYCAECLTQDIFTQADNWDELQVNVREAVHAYYFDGSIPERVRLHLVRDRVGTLHSILRAVCAIRVSAARTLSTICDAPLVMP